MRISLVSMPWNLLETPSLPLGLLAVRTDKCRNRHELRLHHANVSWAEYLLAASDGALTPSDYDYVANVGVWHGMGDWIFTSALYGTPHWRREEYRGYLARNGVPAGASEEMAEHAAGFIDLLAEEIVSARPDVIGFSSTFQQNVPSLALARAVKRLAPGIRTVFGGGNCDAPMGPALHRNFPFVDYVISGEAEQSYVQFLDHLDGLLPVEKVHGLSWRDAGGGTVTNRPGPLLPMSEVPCPDFDPWFGMIEASPVRPYLKPVLLYEASRGCWWGEKHTCTFCGLNGLTMKYRSRPADEVHQHLKRLVERHRVLDVVAVDNIMDLDYLRSLLPAVAADGWDLNFYYEVKSNLSERDVAVMRSAGLVHIQPGIENLSTGVLKIMDKGVHATQNVRLLRSCEENDVTVDWNYLYGFPGELDEQYETVLEQLPALVHLQPPGGALRILLERYSPYFQRPELGFPQRSPASLYRHVYDLPEEELADLVYQFDTPEAGIGQAVGTRLRDAVVEWNRNYAHSSLYLSDGEGHGDDNGDGGGGLPVVVDRRVGWPARRIGLGGRAAAAAYRLLRGPRTPRGLRDRLAAEGHEVEAEQITEWLRSWREQGLVFEEGGRAVALATSRTSIKRGVGAERSQAASASGPASASPSGSGSGSVPAMAGG